MGGWSHCLVFAVPFAAVSVSSSVVILDMKGAFEVICGGCGYFRWDGSSHCAFQCDSMACSCTLHLSRRVTFAAV